MNQNEVCKPHYLATPGIVVAGAVNKYQVHRIGVLETESPTASGFNLDYTEHRVRCIHAKRGSAAVTEPPSTVAMSAISNK